MQMPAAGLGAAVPCASNPAPYHQGLSQQVTTTHATGSCWCDGAEISSLQIMVLKAKAIICYGAVLTDAANAQAGKP